MFLASTASVITTTSVHVALVCCITRPRSVDLAEATERLVRSARIEAVDVDLAIAVLERAPRRRQIDADLSLELLRETEHQLVDERLMDVRIEGERAELRRARGRGVGQLEDAVAVRVELLDALPLRRLRERTVGRDRIAAVDLLDQAAVEDADDVARIFREERRQPEPRTDVGAVHPLDLVDVVEAPDEVDAETGIRGHRVRLPRVLRVERVVASRAAVVSVSAGLVAAVERHQPGGGSFGSRARGARG